jgi:hypothetical protein
MYEIYFTLTSCSLVSLLKTTWNVGIVEVIKELHYTKICDLKVGWPWNSKQIFRCVMIHVHAK